jgi:hypothetical protein
MNAAATTGMGGGARQPDSHSVHSAKRKPTIGRRRGFANKTNVPNQRDAAGDVESRVHVNFSLFGEDVSMAR